MIKPESRGLLRAAAAIPADILLDNLIAANQRTLGGQPMRFSAALLCVIFALATPAAAQTEVTSAIESVTVYPDGATVTRRIRVDLPQGDSVLRAIDFPPTLDPASLRLEGEARAKLTIGGIDARPPRAERPPADPGLDDRIQSLRDDRDRLDGKIAAATARRKFAERFSEQAPAGLGDKGEARPLGEWRAAFAAVEDEIMAADATIREARIIQRNIDRELARLDAQRTANPPRKMEVRIDINADAATGATLLVSYTVRGARWSPIYDARLDTGGHGRKPSIDLVRRAEIVQATGEDWNNVELAVSTVRTAKGGSAPELRPLIVRYPAPPRPLPQGAQAPARAFPPAAAPSLMERKAETAPARSNDDNIAAEEQEAAADTGSFQAVYRIPGRVSVAASEGTKSFRMSSAVIVPDLVVRAAPALDATAFLEANFKHAEDAPLLPGRVAIYRDGVYVGRGQMAMTAKDEDVRLGFGADDNIKIVRSMVRQIEGSAGIISSAKTERREFKTSIRNAHDAPIRVVIEDQVPVSEIDDVKVELLPVTTAPTEKDVRNRRGVMAWSLEVAPGEAKEIRIAWRVRFPADKTVVFVTGQ
jgi:uncharacterized protein (TIGR02231 family)